MMEKQSITKLVLFCITFFAFISCEKSSNQSVTDAMSDSAILSVTTPHNHSNVSQPATATTKAINTPEYASFISVKYPKNGGNITWVEYYTNESIDQLLTKMRNAVNTDQDAEITAEIDLSNDKITFTEKTSGSFANSNQVEISMASSYPTIFDPMIIDMSGGMD